MGCRIHGKVPPKVPEAGKQQVSEAQVPLVGAVTSSSLDLPKGRSWASLEEIARVAGSAKTMVRRRSAVALRLARTPRAIPVLTQLSMDQDPQTRKHAGWSLGVLAKHLKKEAHPQFSEDLVKRVEQTLYSLGLDEHENVRDFALFAKARLGDPEAQLEVLAVLADEARPPIRRGHGVQALEEVREALPEAAWRGLESMGERIADPRLRAQVVALAQRSPG